MQLKIIKEKYDKRGKCGEYDKECGWFYHNEDFNLGIFQIKDNSECINLYMKGEGFRQNQKELVMWYEKEDGRDLELRDRNWWF